MLNIALTFDSPTNKSLEKLSKQSHPDNVYILGENSEPHLSLTHIDGEKEDVDHYAHILKQHFDVFEWTFNAGDFYAQSRENDPRIYYGFSTTNDRILHDIHQRILNAFPNKGIHNEHGDNFFPHITLGCVEGEPTIAKTIQEPNKWTTPVTGYLSIGSSNSYGRMEKKYKIIS